MTEVAENIDSILMDPLRGEVFSLTSYLQQRPSRQTGNEDDGSLTISRMINLYYFLTFSSIQNTRWTTPGKPV